MKKLELVVLMSVLVITIAVIVVSGQSKRRSQDFRSRASSGDVTTSNSGVLYSKDSQITASATIKTENRPTEAVIDGKLDTWWNSGKFGPTSDPQWIEFKLKAPVFIDHVRLNPQIFPSPAEELIEVYAGTTPAPATKVSEISESAVANQWVESRFAPVTAQYVRFKITNAKSWIAFNEIEVYGPYLLSKDAKVRATNSLNSTQVPGAVVDENIGTFWNSGNFPPQSIELNMESPQKVKYLRLLVQMNPPGAQKIRIYGGNTPNSNLLIAEINQQMKAGDWIVYTFPNEQLLQYVKIETLSGPSWVAWSEIQVYGNQPKVVGTDVPTATPTIISLNPTEHRIGIRSEGSTQNFYDRLTNQKFIPRGTNYIRMTNQEDPWIPRSNFLYHSTFNPGQYDAVKAENALKKMEQFGYNTVRVFLNDWAIGKTSGGLSDSYVMNVIDFLQRAKAHSIYVLVTFLYLPKVGGYYGANVSQVEGVNNLYLSQSHIDGKKRYVSDFITKLKQFNAPFQAILAYSLENEANFEKDKKPFTIQSGTVTPANGKTYLMPSELRPLVNEGMVYWFNEVRKVIKQIDQTALVTVGFFSEAAGSPDRIPAAHAMVLDPQEGGSTADFLDIHAYAGFRSFAEEMSSFLPTRSSRPRLLGEFGGFVQSFGNAHNESSYRSLTQALTQWMKNSCTYNFKGWLFWTWDTSEQSELYNAVEANDVINYSIAPSALSEVCPN